MNEANTTKPTPEDEDMDKAEVRRAVAATDPVAPDREGARIIQVPRLGAVGFQVLWEDDDAPEDVEDSLGSWPESARLLQESGECHYEMCSVRATCGHLEAQADIGLVQVAENGGADKEEIERDLAVEAILSLMRQAESRGREAQAAR